MNATADHSRSRSPELALARALPLALVLAGLSRAQTAQPPLPLPDPSSRLPVGRGLEAPPAEPPGSPSLGGRCGEVATVPNVYLHAGELHLEVEDLRIPGRGLDFVWARKYRSCRGPSSALGHGWDFSYNQRIALVGQDVRLFDGNSRADLYRRQPDGSYVARQFFRVGHFELDGSFTLTFADTGKWSFGPLTGAAAGRIQSIVDRNGNALAFAYDGLGRLVTVTDTLDRTVSVGYGASGMLETVTDFTGRTVRYAHYVNGDAGGSAGDLKSVTTPIVVGTPNGNDFPGGKTTVYTYSKGFADARLNHNLLTVTDPKGQTWMVNTYAPTLDRKDFYFDRLVKQQRGGPSDTYELVYLQLAGVPGDPHAPVVRAIVNDPVGNVREYSYDARNRLVMRREFTGRANPGLPTTATTNRPVGPLRGDDPPYFETRWEHDDDSLVTRTVHPNGNEMLQVHERELDPAAGPLERGNLRERRRIPGLHAPAGDQTELVETFEYSAGIGGCCGNFVTRHVDARGNQTVHLYDASGNRLQTTHRIPSIVETWEYNAFGQMTAHVLPDNGSGHLRRDEYRYYTPADGAQNGYLKDIVVDAPNLALTTHFEYDAVGNTVRKVDPRGNDTLTTLNALDQVVRERSPVVTGARIEKLHWYDANDNLVRTDVENRDENGVLQANTHFTTTWDHELLNLVVLELRELDSSTNVHTEYAYDANRNRTLVRHPLAVLGLQPSNTLTTEYDERDLVYREIRAAGAAEQSTTQHDYDANQNERALREGLESGAHVTLCVYDGFDRRVQVLDPMGNVTEHRYDPNGNVGGNRTEAPPVAHVFGERVTGELLDVPGSAGNLRLSQTTYQYDAMDRRVRETVEHFDPATQAPIGDGQRVTLTAWTDASQLWQRTDDHGHVSTLAYDTANRRALATDPRGNRESFAYDANGNVLVGTETDESDLGAPDRVVATTFAYDALDRRTTRTEALGQVTTWEYDSRGNHVRGVDPRGNVTRYLYDGLSRLVRTERDLTDTGTGGGIVVGTIVTLEGWDASSRRVSQTDGRGNTTVYAYDGLDRPVRTDYTDGTADETLLYDAHDRVLIARDPAGSVVTTSYDELDRLSGRSIAPGPGVSADTTFESYQYDGRSRLVRAQDDDSLVTRSHDSLGSLLLESTQVLPAGAVHTVAMVHDALGLQTRLVYPGGRVIERTYDALERPLQVKDQGAPFSIATNRYFGPVLERRDFGNGTRLDVSHDGARRIVQTRHSRVAGNVTLDQRIQAWDPAGNRQSVLVVLTGVQTNYQYDSVGRLTRSTVNPPGTSTQYVLDDAENRVQVVGGPDAGVYSCDPTFPAPADCQTNQYTATPFDTRIYDANGSLTQINGVNPGTLRLDFSDMCVQFATGAMVASHIYDCLDRRLQSTDGPVTRGWSYDGNFAIEERSSSGPTIGWVRWGGCFSWSDVPVIETELVPLSLVSCGEILRIDRGAQQSYCHLDDLGSTVLVTDPGAVPAERYAYADFGVVSYFTGGGAPLPSSALGIRDLFRGWYLEERFYGVDSRWYDPRAGRFVERDPAGLWADPFGWGNGCVLLGNNPFRPLGANSGSEDDRPWIATVDPRFARGSTPSFFDVTFVGFPNLPMPEIDVPPFFCFGPCRGEGPVRKSRWIDARSWNFTKKAAQDDACKAAEKDSARARAIADIQCMLRGLSQRCRCNGTPFLQMGVPEKRRDPPRLERWQRRWYAVDQVRYSCRAVYRGNCARQ